MYTNKTSMSTWAAFFLREYYSQTDIEVKNKISQVNAVLRALEMI